LQAKLIKTIDLENNMQLNFYDASKKLAGDRWLISLIIRMEIPVNEVLTDGSQQGLESVNEIKNRLGEKVLFEQKRERIFVNESEKETALKELYDTFLDNTLQYLSKEAFPKQYILKKFKEKVEEKSWYH
jgi:hypothetical protein